MQLLGFILLLTLLLFPLPAFCYDVLVLQSMHEKGYEEAVAGFRRECRASMRRIVLTEFVEADIVRITREEHPKLIVAVGERALELAKKQRGTPVLYMMALNATPGRGVGGVSMHIDPARYLCVFDSLGVERVGVIYDQERSGAYLKRARAAAARNRVTLVLREVANPKETPAMLQSLKDKVDAVWMLPDATAVSPATTEAYFLFSQGERVPVISFAEVYLSMGGAVALTIDRHDIGRQLGEMARDVLQGVEFEALPVQYPRRAVTRSNDGVVRRLNLSGRL